MKIALASLPVLNRQPEQNIETILRAMQICSRKTDLLVFGEAAMHGFDCLTWDYDTDCALALSQTDPSIRRICHAAKRFGIGVSFGYFEKAANTIYSSQIVIDASGGVLYNFRRVSVGWKDLHRADAHYREGGAFRYLPLSKQVLHHRSVRRSVDGRLRGEGQKATRRCRPLAGLVRLLPLRVEYAEQV